MKKSNTNGKQIFISTYMTDGIFLYAEIKKKKWYHKLGLVSIYKDLVEESDYILVKKKPKCTIIVPNSDENYEYRVGIKEDMDEN